MTPSLGHSTLPDGRRQVVATFNTATLPDGALTVRFDVTDRSGRAATQLVVSRTIDNTAPAISVSGVSGGAWYPGPRTISFSQTETNPGR
ncbi:MAG: hypothetical protein HS111_28795 [Kofleriaceae bacterium]|nr:hypothetical protein [Kofleriaceae bacterium]